MQNGGTFWVPRVDQQELAQPSHRSDDAARGGQKQKYRDSDTKGGDRTAVPPSEKRPVTKATARSGFRLQKALRGGERAVEGGEKTKVEGTPRVAEASVV
jgi:hypothetical protein|eukprot:COSAG02_NODE_3000_length_7578_cov_218.918305_7_plen_100_part_00